LWLDNDSVEVYRSYSNIHR